MFYGGVQILEPVTASRGIRLTSVVGGPDVVQFIAYSACSSWFVSNRVIVFSIDRTSSLMSNRLELNGDEVRSYELASCVQNSRPEPHSEHRSFCKTKDLNNRISITSLNNRVVRLYNDENENRGLESLCRNSNRCRFVKSRKSSQVMMAGADR